jgi:sugar-specific transcriptional regulator TrmB
LDLFGELSRRVAQLEERVEELQEAENAREHSQLSREKGNRRNRRKFGDLVREHMVKYPLCSALYVSASMDQRLLSRITGRSSTAGPFRTIRTYPEAKKESCLICTVTCCKI